LDRGQVGAQLLDQISEEVELHVGPLGFVHVGVQRVDIPDAAAILGSAEHLTHQTPIFGPVLIDMRQDDGVICGRERHPLGTSAANGFGHEDRDG